MVSFVSKQVSWQEQMWHVFILVRTQSWLFFAKIICSDYSVAIFIMHYLYKVIDVHSTSWSNKEKVQSRLQSGRKSRRWKLEGQVNEAVNLLVRWGFGGGIALFVSISLSASLWPSVSLILIHSFTVFVKQANKNTITKWITYQIKQKKSAKIYNL